MSDPVIGVVGLGRLGLCLAAVLSVDCDYEVWGADKSEELVTAVTNGEPPNAWEPGLTALVQEWCTSAPKPGPFGYNAGNVSVAGTDTAAMAERCDVVFVVVPTPSLPSGEFDDSMVRDAVAEVCAGFARRERVTRPVIVCVSTLMPGATDAIAREVKRLGSDAAVLYGPAFIALGSVIADLRSPDVVLIGGEAEDADAILTVLGIWQDVAGDVDKRVMSRVSAELAKLSLNCALSIKIGFGNTVARFCERFPGADASDVLGMVGADHRIGSALLRHGGTPSGPCLGRDLRAWQTLNGEEWADYAGVARQASADVVEWVMGHVQEALSALVDEPRGHADVAVIGMVYKNATPVTDDSLGLAVCAALAYERVDYCAHDPLVTVDPDRACTIEEALSCPIVISCAEWLDAWPDVAFVAREDQVVVDIWSVWSDGPGVIKPGVWRGHRR